MSERVQRGELVQRGLNLCSERDLQKIAGYPRYRYHSMLEIIFIPLGVYFGPREIDFFALTG